MGAKHPHFFFLYIKINFKMAKKKNENPIILNYKEALKRMKEEMLQEILDDDVMTKVEKLEAISENDLLPYDGYIQQPFLKYYDPFKEIIWSNPDFDRKYGGYRMPNGRKYDPLIDDIFHSDRWDRHEKIDMSQLVRDYEEDDWYDDEEEGKEGKVVILTNRSTNDVFRITKEQFIDDIYEWCIENQKIGFILDW